ncbi:MAG: hypothetical protein ACI9S8_002776 [Chlamydiales bacterium]|jgi:hypothetical protein
MRGAFREKLMVNNLDPSRNDHFIPNPATDISGTNSSGRKISLEDSEQVARASLCQVCQPDIEVEIG